MPGRQAIIDDAVRGVPLLQLVLIATDMLCAFDRLC